MAQHDYVISNGTGAAVRSDLNNALLAIVSNNSGATAPSPTYAYQLWADTTTNLLKLRNGANSAWITVGDLTAANLGLATVASPTFTGTATIPTLTVSSAANIPLGSAGSPTLYFTGDSNTGLYSPGADQVALSTGGTGRLFINSSGSVGIGDSSPSAKLVCNGSIQVTSSTNPSTGAGLEIGYGTVNASRTALQSYNRTGSAWLGADYNALDHRFYISGGGSPQMTLTSTGLGIGVTSPAATLDSVAESTNGFGVRIRGRASDSYGAIQFTTNDGSSQTAALGVSSNTLVISTGSTERARIDSSGRLLVGTSTSTNNIRIGQKIASVATGGADYGGASLTTYAGASQAVRPVLDFQKSRGSTDGSLTSVAAGDILGTIVFRGSDGSAFQDSAYIDAIVEGTPAAGKIASRLVFSTTADGASSPTERMRIRSDGAFTLSDNATLDPIGSSKVGGFAAGNGANSGAINYYAGNTIALKLGRGNDGAVCQFFRNQPGATSVGDISVTTTATTYNSASDYRLKENIVPLSDGIIRLMQLKPSRFNFIVEPDVVVDGFIAHEAQEIVPQAVTGTKDAVDADGNPIYQGIDQSKLVPLLTAALQEAVAKIESLEARLTAAGI